MRLTRIALLVGTALAAATMVSISANASLLVAAGGGGGAGYCCGTPGDAGQAGWNGSNGLGPSGGAGGVNGNGGQGGTNPFVGQNGGGGAGWFSSGTDGVGSRPPGVGTAGNGGKNFTFMGGAGGSFSNSSAGGYGGGGGGGYQGGGGGGGYSGGGGGDGATAAGGGGGSFVDPSFVFSSGTPGVNGVANGAGGTGLDGFVLIDATLFSFTGSMQNYVVPVSGFYTLTVDGAQGGSGSYVNDIGGYGAEMDGIVFLNGGTTLNILVGGAGLTGDFESEWAGGGGGGSFIFTGSPPPLSPAVPEPSSLSILAVCLVGFGFAGYFARQRRV